MKVRDGNQVRDKAADIAVGVDLDGVKHMTLNASTPTPVNPNAGKLGLRLSCQSADGAMEFLLEQCRPRSLFGRNSVGRVDHALTLTGTVQKRLRVLPSSVVVYLLIAAGLFPRSGLSAGLGPAGRRAARHPGRHTQFPALAQARRRIGLTPLTALFGLLARPAARAASGTIRRRELLACAIDSTTLFVADGPADVSRFGYQAAGVLTETVVDLLVSRDPVCFTSS